MNKLPVVANEAVTGPSTPFPARNYRPLFFVLGGVALGFALPLLDLLRLTLHSELYSHIILIPFVSAYFVWLKRNELPVGSKPSIPVAAVAFILGATALIYYWTASSRQIVLVRDDRLAFQMVAFVCIIIGTCATFLGRRTLVALSFPLGFLLFMVPFPVAAVNALENFFQHTSAATAGAFFKSAGTTFFRNETFFQLPGINLQVAPECSGIRSSLALFITSLVAGQLFLRSPFLRGLLAFFVIPLGIARNGLRIFVIGELCVHRGPHMIDSWVHHHGGPLFFAISLVPFSAFLWFLMRMDGRKKRPFAQSETAALPSTAV